jgi:hypothetical protein
MRRRVMTTPKASSPDQVRSAQLDEAIEGTFPASDPFSIGAVRDYGGVEVSKECEMTPPAPAKRKPEPNRR